MNDSLHNQVTETPVHRTVCPYGDLGCPCPDGLMCHYEGPDAWPKDGRDLTDLDR